MDTRRQAVWRYQDIRETSDHYIELDYKYGESPIAYRAYLESLPKHFGCE